MPLNKPKSSMLDAGSTAAPQNLGATASAGTGPAFSFADHVHALPTPAQIGALSTSQIAGLASTAPAALAATAAVGTSSSAARADHVHARPSASEVGAIPSADKAVANGVASLDGSARLNSVQMPALSGDITLTAGTTNTAAVNKLKGKSVATPTIAGSVAQFDGTDIVWGDVPAGGSGGGGVVLFFNYGTTADTPTTGLPTLVNGATYKELRRVGESAASSMTSNILTSSYSNVIGFVTDIGDPSTTQVTAGLWDFNVWVSSTGNSSTIKALLYKYNGTTQSSTLLQTSNIEVVGITSVQHVLSLAVPQSTILDTDRLCVVFQAASTGNNQTVTFTFGDVTPSHVHTTVASVGGSGVPKVVNGVTQGLASKVINEDISDTAAISQSKIDGLTTALSGKVGTGDTIAIAKGGTGATTQQAAINALAGTQVSGRFLRSDGTNTSLSAIQVADVPTLNQDTTGTAANVTGTVAIAKGGTGQTTKDAAFNALSPITTTGDLIIGTGANTAGRVAIGTNGKVLTSNGTTATWETPAAGGGVTTIANGGTGATTAQTAISNLGVGMRMVEAQTSANIVGNMVGNVFTVGSVGVFTTDGYTPVLGDIITFALQGTLAQNGFWEVTTVGTASVAAVFTRPAWFTGTVRNGMYMTRFGTAQSGYVMAFYNSVQNADIIIGTSGITIVRVSYRTQNATTQTNTFGGAQTLRANGAGSNSVPFFFQAGTALMVTPQAHAVEWFSDQLYATTSTVIRKKLPFLEDSVTINATASSAVVFDIESSEVVYYTANTNSDFSLNLRGSSTLTMNSILEVNKARTVVLMVTNSTTAYKISTVSIDGTAQTVKWLGGSAPTSGNVSSIDSYSFTVIKTAASTYTVLGSFARFA